MGNMGVIHASPKGYAGHDGDYVAPTVPMKKLFFKRTRSKCSGKDGNLPRSRKQVFGERKKKREVLLRSRKKEWERWGLCGTCGAEKKQLAKRKGSNCSGNNGNLLRQQEATVLEEKKQRGGPATQETTNEWEIWESWELCGTCGADEKGSLSKEQEAKIQRSNKRAALTSSPSEPQVPHNPHLSHSSHYSFF
jgi:hypothetical protein